MPTPAYRSHASGLYVPEPLSRTREVWPKDDWKVIDRATKILQAYGVSVFLGCWDDQCRSAPIDRIRNDDGTITLRCAHKDRVWQA